MTSIDLQYNGTYIHYIHYLREDKRFKEYWKIFEVWGSISPAVILFYSIQEELDLKNLITEAIGASFAPSADLIEAVSYSSTNPLFKKNKFRRCLIEYRKTGLYSGQPRKSNANIERYYIKIRKNFAINQGERK